MGILDRVKEVITVDISEKISYGNRIRNLSGEISANESTIKNLINQVGLRCVALHINETDSEYGDLFRKILELRKCNSTLTEQIQILKKEQEEEEKKRQQMREETQLAKQQKKKEQTQDSSVKKNGKACTQCGKDNDEDAAFCVHCGNPFLNKSAEETAETEAADVL